MQGELTAEDVAPLIAKLSGPERVRLLRLVASLGAEGQVYAATPPSEDEFGADDDPLGWDAAGWEDVG